MANLQRSLFFSFVGKYSSMLLQFVSVMVISRVLTPADIGIYSLALGSIAIGQVLRDFGLSLYLIKEKELDQDKIQGSFTISIIICWLLAATYFLVAPFMGSFFEHKSVGTLTKILAFNFLIIPFGTFTLSILKRQMHFDKIMLIDIASASIATAFSIVAILIWRSVEVLALASVLGTITTVLCTFKYADWSNFKINFLKVKEIAKFSGYVSGANILNQLRSVIPEFLIGKYSSLADVGYFSKANGTINLFSKLISNVITPVIQPFIARLKNRAEAIDRPIYQVKHYMLAVQWPFCIFIYVFSADVIRVLYGDQWGATVPLLKLCSLLFLIDGFAVLGIELINAVGDVKYVLRLSMIITILRIALVASLIQYGLESVLYSFIILAFIRSLMLVYRYKKCFSISYRRLLRVYFLNALLALFTLIFCLISYYFLLFENTEVERVFVSAILVGFGWLLSVYILNHPVKEQITKLIKYSAKKLLCS